MVYSALLLSNQSYSLMSDLNAQAGALADASIGFDAARAKHLIERSENGWLGKLQHFAQIDSTNAYLLRQTESIHGQVCVADKQTNGRGRLGRKWQGAQVPNIALSIGWQPDHRVDSALSLVVGVAVAEALLAFAVPDIGLKWPNDILAGKRKLGGILVEAVNQGNKTRYAVGVGVNLNLSDEEFEQIEQPSTDMSRLGVSVDRTALIAAMVNSIASMMNVYSKEGLEPFHAKWSALHVYDQQNVEFVCGGSICKGKILGVNEEGALLMQIGEQQRVFMAGEIKVII